MKNEELKNKSKNFVIFLLGLLFFVIGWIEFFSAPTGIYFQRVFQIGSIIVGGFLMWIERL